MIIVKKEGKILSKTALGFEDEGVLNPAVIMNSDGIHLFYRAVGKGNFSSIGYCRLKDPLTVDYRSDIPLIFPQYEYETHGVEDPRIVIIDDLYYLTYTAYDGVNALGALATSLDLITFEKQGVIVPQIPYDEFKRLASCQGAINEKYSRFNDRNHFLTNPDKRIWVWDKNLVFFPRRIHGDLYFLHRIKPDIQIVAIQDLSALNKPFWDNYLLHLSEHIVLTPRFRHEVSYIGGGCPPIETEQGWLVIYHGVHDTTKGYVYSACVCLLDLENPMVEIARLPYPLFVPDQVWELKGEVNNVCFPTGAVVIDGILYIYYGAADERIALASCVLIELLTELLIHKTHPK
jgi:beta-1,2-mannobiose phosphorylase / 1,2-beta-oligomannan phosphorylase